jgi:molybdopterin-containing oxidoreductase family membrane subunit
VPFVILSIRKLRTIPLVTFASVAILVGMWLERFLIIIPTLTHPFLPYNHGTYWPSATEATIAGGTVALFVLLYFLFAKLSPMVSIWEIEEGYSMATRSIGAHHPAAIGQTVPGDVHPVH